MLVLAGIRVLVVDDSDITLDVTKRILELNGAEVSLAGNGLEAFELLRNGPTGHDLVLMDVQMPVLDGHAATRKIRETLPHVDLPIIALTAGALSSERQRAEASGMDDFIVKPFDANTLVSSILRHVKRDRHADAGDSAAIGVPDATEDGWPRLHGIDLDLARSRLVGDPYLFMSSLRRLLSEFADLEVPVPTQQMRLTATYAQRMHRLKGSAGMLGAGVIEQLASGAEAACRSGNLDEASSLGGQLCREIQRLRQSAANVLAGDPFGAGNTDSATESGPLDDERLTKLIDMLRAQDLAALDEFNSMSKALSHHLGRPAFEAARELMDQLRLTEAAAALGVSRS